MAVCDSPYYVLPKAGTEKVPVPCGKCPACKKRRVDNWCFRLMQEEKVSTSAHFVTLTYDTDHVPISDNGFMTLQKRDFQLFMKRLRKLSSNVLRYYVAGEYGTQNKRPHYHAILFNLEDTDFLRQAWGLGDIHIGNVSGDSVAYTMKYIDKGVFKPAHQRDDRQCEFSLMSKGLGISYLSDSIVKYHKADISRLFVTRFGGHKSSLPRYYRKKIFSELEQRAQVDLIQKISVDTELEARRFYINLYPDGDEGGFRAYLESRKYGRYQSFQKQVKKNRNV